MNDWNIWTNDAYFYSPKIMLPSGSFIYPIFSIFWKFTTRTHLEEPRNKRGFKTIGKINVNAFGMRSMHLIDYHWLSERWKSFSPFATGDGRAKIHLSKHFTRSIVSSLQQIPSIIQTPNRFLKNKVITKIADAQSKTVVQANCNADQVLEVVCLPDFTGLRYEKNKLIFCLWVIPESVSVF